ncbi:Crp/Fnr family transcriptional regulator [Siminovitchia acidinfaciens]|uniref:Crp/Fnr family transcriptional regulator n=2 Tax=Siminovitchia acidinfaciens TaxID=2321395 RepID=A0A429Y8L1_9BACI|nr:Crp/Fnr family transcriptional regulator [Siminovitchia acidinfaciens]
MTCLLFRYNQIKSLAGRGGKVSNKETLTLHNVPLFHDLDEKELDRLKGITITRFFPKKSIVFKEGARKEAIFFIQKGLVKTFKTDENGHEQIVSFLKTGDMFPHTGFFNQNPYPATAQSIADSTLLAVPIQAFEQLIMEKPSIAIKMMRVMGDIIRGLQERIQVLSGKDVRQRALSFLLTLAGQHGRTAGEKIIIDFPMTHQEFARQK